MSDQKQNTGRTDDMDFSALDEELARMAEETPEVPADFHDNWTRMIREEAAAAKPETTAGKSRKGRGQLRYILSAAAAFVVLIGGVVIARNNGLLKGMPTVSETPVLAASPLTAGKTSEAAEAVYEDAAVPVEQTVFLGMNADSMPAPATEAEEMTAARKADAAESAQNSVLAAPMVMPTAMPAKPAAGVTETNAEAEWEETVSVEAAAEEAESESAVEEAETAAEEAETEEAPEEAAEESAAEEPAPETAEDSGQGDTRSFLQRAWEGILDAVPWILSGAIIVLFILTYVVRPGKKK